MSGRDILTNSIGPEDIKPLGSADIAPNSLLGADINESTLGNVSSATNAVNATNATNATSVSSVDTIPVTTVLEGGPAAVLASYGPFVIRGTCVDNAGATQASVTIDTSENNTTVKGETDADTDFDAADPPATLHTLTDAFVAPPTSTGFTEGLFNAFAPGTGKGAMTGNIASWAQAAAPSQCKFHGSLVRSG